MKILKTKNLSMRLTNGLKLILLVGIVMEVLVLSYYLGYDRGKRVTFSLVSPQSQSQTSSPASSTSSSPATSSPIPTTTSEIDTSDWKTYRNEEYGFSFRYPENFGEINFFEDSGVKDGVYFHRFQGEFTENGTIEFGGATDYILPVPDQIYKPTDFPGFNDEKKWNI